MNCRIANDDTCNSYDKHDRRSNNNKITQNRKLNWKIKFIQQHTVWRVADKVQAWKREKREKHLFFFAFYECALDAAKCIHKFQFQNLTSVILWVGQTRLFRLNMHFIFSSLCYSDTITSSIHTFLCSCCLDSSKIIQSKRCWNSRHDPCRLETVFSTTSSFSRFTVRCLIGLWINSSSVCV